MLVLYLVRFRWALSTKLGLRLPFTIFLFAIYIPTQFISPPFPFPDPLYTARGSTAAAVALEARADPLLRPLCGQSPSPGPPGPLPKSNQSF